MTAENRGRPWRRQLGAKPVATFCENPALPFFMNAAVKNRGRTGIGERAS